MGPQHPSNPWADKNLPEIFAGVRSTELLPLETIAEQIGKSLDVVTRWTTNGRKGLRLPYIEAGQTRMTTEAIFMRWSVAVTELGTTNPTSKPARVNGKRRSRGRAQRMASAYRRMASGEASSDGTSSS